MKKEKRLISIFMILAMIAAAMFLAACSGGEDEDDSGEITDLNDEAMVLVLDLESDSDNGVEWTFEQDNEIFSCEDVFLVNEADEEGDEEVQSFTLRPAKGGDVTISFSNESTDTTYTYECTVSEDLTSIVVNSSKGESAGSEVEPPNVVLERN